MNAVGIDVSKGKSTVTSAAPEMWFLCSPCDIPHTSPLSMLSFSRSRSLDGETKACMEHTADTMNLLLTGSPTPASL